ncbi:P-loop containing nucleoside triphosphate hydrolase protein [Lactifluus volemus]|nr:P-loop containing nucleoside triphosphate hydrolase protein [Lactifluus volemus]
MLQGLATRSYNVYRVHPNDIASSLRRAYPLSRSVLVSSRYAAVPSIRHYAQTPPGGPAGSGGIPGFKFPMQQQYSKGTLLKNLYVHWEFAVTSIDLTELAKTGKLDPVIGRDEEIRRTIQILSRRTKSNPVLIGPPGVGKTAILEGLASRIVAKEVPESLHNKRVLSIDLSAIMAGSGIRGQFEEKFKALIRDIENEPALARGLQLVGATTPDEYRKTISKDAALERRFQPVTIEEPTVESTISILRGLKPRYEVHHGVEISDGALVTAAVYAARYISDRFLPDKAIDLIELTSLRNESDPLSIERREDLEQALERTRKDAAALEKQWKAERERLQRNKERKNRLEEAKHQLEVAQRKGDFETASRLRYATIPELERETPPVDDIARVVARATGIPVQSLLKGERERLVHMEDSLKTRVVGQDHVVRAVSDAVRISRAGLQAPTRPVASFLFLGPTGVGKTELCKALAGFLFNDEQRALININMSEYHDRHTMSRLIGAAPGYVGFEEGGKCSRACWLVPDAYQNLGQLTEADVTMLLLQILDEGTITDSQGRKVDFRNTIICLTSNIGSDILAHPTASDSSGVVTPGARTEVLERVTEQFPPELLNRLDSMLVFNRLAHESILRVVDLRLGDVAARLAQRRIKLDIDDATRAWLAKRGFSDVYGARAIARVVRTEVLFPLAQKLLVGTIRDGDIVEIRVGTDGEALHIRDNHATGDEQADPTAMSPNH